MLGILKNLRQKITRGHVFLAFALIAMIPIVRIVAELRLYPRTTRTLHLSSQAIQEGENKLRAARKTYQTGEIINAAIALARLYTLDGNYRRAIEVLGKVIEDEAINPTEKVPLHIALADTNLDMGGFASYKPAYDNYMRVLDIAYQTNNQQLVGRMKLKLALVKFMIATDSRNCGLEQRTWAIREGTDLANEASAIAAQLNDPEMATIAKNYKELLALEGSAFPKVVFSGQIRN